MDRPRVDKIIDLNSSRLEEETDMGLEELGLDLSLALPVGDILLPVGLMVETNSGNPRLKKKSKKTNGSLKKVKVALKVGESGAASQW